MTLWDRVNAFNAAYAKWPASHLHVVEESGKPVLYGRWLIGQDYRNKTRYYGAYPNGYLDRVMALFPDVVARKTITPPILHVFSGSLPKGNYVRLDLKAACDIRGSVYRAAELMPWRFPLIIADPPYSTEDAKKYGTPMVDRPRAIRALFDVAEPGAHLVWLDQVWPMHAKRQWRTVGRIALTRSTNHRLRDITIFERQAA